jgi:hypothetical protein
VTRGFNECFVSCVDGDGCTARNIDRFRRAAVWSLDRSEGSEGAKRDEPPFLREEPGQMQIRLVRLEAS